MYIHSYDCKKEGIFLPSYFISLLIFPSRYPFPCLFWSFHRYVFIYICVYGFIFVSFPLPPYSTSTRYLYSRSRLKIVTLQVNPRILFNWDSTFIPVLSPLYEKVIVELRDKLCLQSFEKTFLGLSFVKSDIPGQQR